MFLFFLVFFWFLRNCCRCVPFLRMPFGRSFLLTCCRCVPFCRMPFWRSFLRTCCRCVPFCRMPFFRSFLRTCCRYILYWLIPFASCIHDKSSQFQGATSSESEPRMQERNGNDQGTERVLEPKLFVQISGQRGHAFLGLRFGIRVYGKLREC